jgi:TonB family protein
MKLRLAVLLVSGLCLATLAQDNTPVKSSEGPKDASTRGMSQAFLPPIPPNYPRVDYPKGMPTPLPEGTVSLSATVNEQGKAESVVIVHPMNPELDAAATAAVSHWKFIPATQQGTPVPSQVSIDVVFTSPHPYTLINGIDRLDVGVTPPRAIYAPDPEYADAARKAKILGTVVLSLVVSAAGLPEHIRVAKSLDPGLDQEAVDAVKKWKFEPAMRSGKPVAIAIAVEVNFKGY